MGPVRPRMDEVSQQWVSELLSDGDLREVAVLRLHELMLRMARAEASRRTGWYGIRGRELDDLAVQAADDAVVSILRKVGDFRGDSRFTTWACTFAIREVSTKFGRHVWRRDGVRLDDEGWDRLPSRSAAGPEEVTEARDLVAAVRSAVDEVLSDHQRRVFVALVVRGVPLDALVAELGSNRNAVYKTMFDARRKLWAHLETHGYLDGREG